MKYLTLLITFIGATLLCTKAQAQSDDYTLLWEVKSPDNSQPSYLFGTMHLKTDKVFNIPDTLLPLINACEGFSLEVNFDTALAEMVDQMFNADTLVYEDEEETVEAPRFSYTDFKNFKNAISIEVNADNDNEAAAIEIEEVEDHEMILDAYLLYMAKRNKKSIFGLEHLSDQANVLEERLDIDIKVDTNSAEDSEKKVSLTIDTLISLYQKGDYEEIYEFIFETGDSLAIYNLLDRRNFKMAENIAKFSAERSMFYAIGSGHLGGPNGVVKLLRDAGLTVTPVKSTFTKKYRSIDQATPQLPWERFDVPNAPFSVEFQNTPTTLHKQLEGITLYTSYDIFNERFLSVYSLVFPRGDLSESDLLDQYTNAIGKSIDIIEVDKVKFEGKEGREIYYYRDNYRVHNRYFYHEGQLIFLEFLYPRYSFVQNSAMEHFFESITFESITTPVGGFEWYSYTDTLGAVRVNFPGKPKKQIMPIDSEGSSFMLNLISQSSPTSEYNYIFRWYDLPLGSIVTNDSSTVEERMDGMALEFGEPLNSQWINHKGMLCLESDFKINDLYNVIIRECNYGNRSYTAMAQFVNDSDQRTQANYYLNSVDPLEPEKVELKRIDLDSINASIKAPTEMPIDGDYYWLQDSYLSDTAYNYYAQDRFTGDAYMIFYAKYNHFFYKDSLEAWVEEEITDYMTEDEGDSLGAVVIFEDEGRLGGEATIYKGKSQNTYRIRTFIEGRDVYTIGVYAAENRSVHEEYLNSFEYPRQQGEFDPFVKKGTVILDSLRSSDTVQAELAEDMIDSAQFEADQIQLLYDIIGDSLLGINEQYAKRRVLEIIAQYKLPESNSFFDSLVLHSKDELIIQAANEQFKNNDSATWMNAMLRNTDNSYFPVFEEDPWRHFSFYRDIVYDSVDVLITHMKR